MDLRQDICSKLPPTHDKIEDSNFIKWQQHCSVRLEWKENNLMKLRVAGNMS